MDPIGAQLAMKKNEGFLNTRKISVRHRKTSELAETKIYETFVAGFVCEDAREAADA